MMLPLDVKSGGDRPLVEQVVSGIRRQIDDRQLPPGTRLPSIRSFDKLYSFSRFTVVEAYDRLVAMGYLHPRRGAGFYTAGAPTPPEGPQPAASGAHQHNE